MSTTTLLEGSRFAETTLANGLKVVAIERRGAPVVTIQVWVGVGSADETPQQAGLAHVHEHMLFKGTLRDGKVHRGVGEIAATIEGAGGEINAWTSYDQTVYHVVLGSEEFNTGLDVLSDAVFHSAFDADELARELDVILEEIKRSEDQPQGRMSKAMFGTAFQHHTYHRPVIGYRDVVAGFTRAHVTEFFEQHYCANRMTVVVVGDVDAQDALARVDTYFGHARGGAKPLPARPVEPAQDGLRVVGLVDDVEESHLQVGFRGFAMGSLDTATADVLAVILGQGDSARLPRSLKREQHVMNEAWAYSYTPRDPGLFVVGGSLHHDKLGDAMHALGHELRRAVDGITPAELDKAKAQLAAEAVYQRETVQGIARRMGTWLLLTNDARYEAVYQERVARVSVEQVRALARKLFQPHHATVVALVPRAHEALVESSRLLALGSAALTPPVRTASVVQQAVERHVLHNGTRVIIERDAANPIISMRAAWLGGLRAENAHTAGYTALCAELFSKGTRRRHAVELAELLDATASSLDGFAGRNSFGAQATFLTQHASLGLELFFEHLTDVSFAQNELEVQRPQTLEELRSRQDNPAGVAFDLFGKHLWKVHPYRNDPLGTPTSIQAATSEGLRSFFFARALPSDVVLSFAGDVDVDQVLMACERYTLAPALTAAPVTHEEEAAPTPITVRQHKDRAQTHIVTGVRGLALSDPDKHALEVLNSAWSGQGGRLFLDLRDKQSLCYSVGAYSLEGLEPGSFAVYIGTSPDKVERALQGIEVQWAQMMEGGITEDELRRTKRYLAGSHAISLQRIGGRATSMALNELYGLGHLAHKEHLKHLQAVTRDDVLRVARKVMSRPRVTAIVGPQAS
jgi:zinc protease